MTCKTMVPERWTWRVIWDGPKDYDAYIACRFLHALSVYSVEDVILSITNFTVLKMAFVILKKRGDAIEVARKCRIKNLIIWRIIS